MVDYCSISLLIIAFCRLNLGDTVKASGDYELQVLLMELLFRLKSHSLRKQHLDDLFPDDHIMQENFLRIKDATFEKDCRIFLNTVNDGKEQRMYSDNYFTNLRPEGGGVNGTLVVFAYLIIATGDEQKEKNRIKI